MEIAGTKLLLHKDIYLKPVGGLSMAIAEKLGGNQGDYIISLKNSREHSKRISKECKLFLDELTEPDLLVSAVARHAGRYNIDPGLLLTDIYPLVKSFLTYGFLEYCTGEKLPVKKMLFSDGEKVNGYTIISCIRFLDDTEIYKASDKAANPVLLKVIPGNSAGSGLNFENELAIYGILNRRASSYFPMLLGHHEGNTYFMLIIEWINGISLWDIINNPTLAIKKKIKVAASILEAYHELSKNNILHADIHPNNIRVSDSFEIKIFDFGSSVIPGRINTNPENRAGVTCYYEPELAKTMLQDNKKIISTPFSEQYQIAALIYHVLTGSTYLSFGFETVTVLQQIISDPPRPFSDFFIKGKVVESKLCRALQKDPSDRFKNRKEFYCEIKNALAGQVTRIHTSGKKKYRHGPQAFDDVINSFISRYGLDSVKLRIFKINKPFCSFFHGAAGIAYVFYRMSCIKQDPELLSLAALWIYKADLQCDAPGAFDNDAIGLHSSGICKTSVFHYKPGIQVVEALIKDAQGKTAEFNNAVKKFINLLEEAVVSGTNSFLQDPTQGPASLVFGINILCPLCLIKNKKYASRLLFLKQQIISQILPVIHTGLTSEKPFIKNNFLGFAHGYAGLLFSVMDKRLTGVRRYKLHITESLSKLNHLKITVKDGAYWPMEFPETSARVWSGWCHGTAGHILFWLSAYENFSNQLYLENALCAGEYLWNTWRDSVSTLCCGYAGQSLALYKLGQQTKDAKWFERGLEIARSALQAARDFPLKDSLFQGETGIALLAAESLDPARAVWPLCR